MTCPCPWYAEVITADNPAFLKELLTEIGRVDLAEKVDEYIKKVIDGMQGQS